MGSSNDPADYARHSNVDVSKSALMIFALEALAASYGAKAVIEILPDDQFTCSFVVVKGPISQADRDSCAEKAAEIIESFGDQVVG